MLRDTIHAMAREGVISDAQASAILERATSAFGKYRLEAKLGEGGMGEVWKAWEEGLGRWVALKFIKGDHPEDVARFIREAQVAAKLTHPNIVGVHEAGELEGRHFIAMDFVEGDDLKTLRVTERRAVELIKAAAEAVHFAHERGVVHRDLKPANLMVTKDGRLLVMDFGLAKSAGAGISQSGTIVGTPAYMGPEQARGERVDARADVYALGATLYDLVTGRPPFEGENVMAVLMRVEQEEPLAPGCSSDVRTIIAKCMEKDARRRYGSAKELAEDLGRELAGDPIAARPASAMYRLKKRIKKRPLQWALGAMLAAAIGVGAGLAIAAEVAQRREADRRSIIESSMIAIMEAEDELADPTIDLGDIQGKLKGAIARLEAGVRRFDDSKMMFWLGRAHEVLWQNDNAFAWYSRAIDSGADERARFGRARTRLVEYVSLLTVTEQARIDAADTEPHRRRILKWIEEDLAGAKHAAPRVERYRTLADRSRHPDLERELREAAAGGGRTEEAWFLLSLVCGTGGRLAEAQAAAHACLERHPRYLRAILYRGFLRNSQGEHDGAVDDFTLALQLKPDYVEAYINRCWSHFIRGEYREAAADATEAVRLAPGLAVAWSNRGAARGEMKDYLGAIADCTHAIELDPNQTSAYFNRAWSRCLSGDSEGAEADAAVAISRGYRPDEALRISGEAKRRRRDYRGALEAFTESLRLKPGRGGVHSLLAGVKVELGDYAGAIESAGQALALNSRDPGAYYHRGLAFLALRRDEEAARDLTEVLALLPGDRLSLGRRGQAYLNLGRFEEALHDLDGYVAGDPDDYDGLMGRATARGMLGDYRGAMADLERALRVAPADWRDREPAERMVRRAREAIGEDY